jgi:AraC family transcriptional regulator
MNWFRHLNDSLDYIEENITSELDLESIALKAYSSYHHFLRMFYILSGINLGEYIRKRRLTLAASDLLMSDEKVIDIALKYQYQTPESFTKAFKEFHGVSPRDARKHKGVLKSFSKLSFQIKIGGSNEMNYKMIHKDNLNFTGYVIDVTTKNGENFKVIPAFWAELMKNGKFDKLVSKAKDMGIVGVCYGYDKEVTAFKYMIGVNDSSLDDNEAVSISFNEETFAAFEAKGKLPSSIQNTTNYIYNEWFPSSNYEHTAGPEIEVYPEGDANSENYTCYYWVPIKQK